MTPDSSDPPALIDGSVSPRGFPSGETGSPAPMGLLRKNLTRVLQRIQEAAAAAGVDPPQLIAVTKTVPPHVAAALCQLLVEMTAATPQLGENRADVLAVKRDAFAEEPRQALPSGEPPTEDGTARTMAPRWHFIGSIQRNKARRILERSDVLHSIDSVKLARTVQRIATELERVVDVFIEVNLTGEEEKHGLLPSEVSEVLAALTETTSESSFVRVLGLMAMGPARGLKSVDEVFREAAELAAEWTRQTPSSFHGGRCRLSMGMSGDLETAIRFGSDYVRVGSSLFEGLSLDRASAAPSAAPTSGPTSATDSPPDPAGPAASPPTR